MSHLLQKDMNKSQNGVYSVAGGHFTATPTSGSKVVVLSDPGFTINARNIGSAFYWSDVASVKTRHDIPIGNLSIAGNSITFNDKDSNFDASDEVEIYLLGPDKVKVALDLIRSTDGIKKIVDNITEANSGDIKTAVEDLQTVLNAVYSSLSSATRIEEIDPLNLQYLSGETELVNIAAEAEGYIYFPFDGFKFASFQCLWDALASDTLTVTLEATNVDDGSALADITDWTDITEDWTGKTSLTSDELIAISDALSVKALRLKYVNSAGVGDSDLTVYSKLVY